MRGILVALLGLASSAWAQGGLAGEPMSGRWALQSMAGEPFVARAELDLSKPGRVSGMGPCNGFSGALEVDWPEIQVGLLRASRRACPELVQEHAYFAALQGVRRGRLRDGALVLMDGAGREMVFTALPASSGG